MFVNVWEKLTSCDIILVLKKEIDMKNKKQHLNSFLFAVGVSGIDYMIKNSNGNFEKLFQGNISKAIIYYVLLFIVTFVLCEIVFEKIKKMNNRK